MYFSNKSLSTAVFFALAFGVPHLGHADETAGEAEVKLRDYIVQAGDTCVKVAIRELGGRKNYRLVHKYNPSMGKVPHRLKAGTVLKLPVITSPPDAVVTGKNGDVRVQESADPNWELASRGMELFRNWRVNSRERASAELTFTDKSVLEMREKTVVIVFGPTRTNAKITGNRILLSKGALRTRLSELDGKPLEVETPTSTAVFTSGDGLLSATEEKSLIANHGGPTVFVTGKVGKGKGGKAKSKRGNSAEKGPSPVPLKEGFGSQVDKGQAPSPPIPLPESPAWEETSIAALAVNDEAVFVAKFTKIESAVSYRLEISSSGKESKLVSSQTFGPKNSVIEARGLPPGEYTATLATIDSKGFESKPSKSARWNAVASKLISASESKKKKGAGTNLSTDKGTRFSPPEGFWCRTAGQVAGGELPVGRNEIICRSPSGIVTQPVFVEVLPPPMPKPVIPKKPKPWLFVEAFGGGRIFTENVALGHEEDQDARLLGGPTFGASVGAKIIEPLWLVIEGDGGRTDFRNDSGGASLLSLRGLMRLRAIHRKQFALYALGGLGFLYLRDGKEVVTDDVSPGLSLGVTAEFGPWSNVAISLKARSQAEVETPIWSAFFIGAGITVYLSH